MVAWAGLLRPLLQAIKDYDERIDRLSREHPDYALMNFTALPHAPACPRSPMVGFICGSGVVSLSSL